MCVRFTLKLCIIFIFYFLISSTVFCSDLPGIYVSVTNPQGLPIPNFNVTLESNLFIYKFTTDENGKFYAGLILETYKIRTDEWSDKLPYTDKKSIFAGGYCEPYFRPGMRASFKLEEGEAFHLNIVVPESACVNWTEGKRMAAIPERSHSPIASPVRYYNFLPTSFDSGNLDLIIQYGIYEEKDNVAIYKMFSYYPGEVPTILTYDHLTIYADEFRFDKKKQILETKGKVQVDNGKEKIEVKSVKVTIKDKESIFEIKK